MQVKQEHLYIIDRVGKYCFVRSHQRLTTRVYLLGAATISILGAAFMKFSRNRSMCVVCTSDRYQVRSVCTPSAVLVFHSYFHTNDSISKDYAIKEHMSSRCSIFSFPFRVLYISGWFFSFILTFILFIVRFTASYYPFDVFKLFLGHHQNHV